MCTALPSVALENFFVCIIFLFKGYVINIHWKMLANDFAQMGGVGIGRVR
jgi:hypothetical protein